MPPSRAAVAPFVCASCANAIRFNPPRQAVRAFSASAVQQQAPAQHLPRWKQTPPPMKMPFRLRPTPKQPEWRVNTEDAPVNQMYDKFVGRVGEAAKGQEGVRSGKGSDLLPEEVKWLAITHKSHDHGRQGFNDRLAFLGKRILDLQTSIALLNSPPALHTASLTNERNVFQHQALEGAENMTAFSKAQVLSASRLATVARGYGIDKVMRWKPKKSDNLQGSGVDTVLAHTVYSIVGALALQRGGEVAARVARERVLLPLGLR